MSCLPVTLRMMLLPDRVEPQLRLVTQAIIGSKEQEFSKDAMENLRRKERNTSTTVSGEGSLALRPRLRPLLLREDAVARRLLNRLRDALRLQQLILISAPPDGLE